VVFDASQATASGYSLNDLLAKGTNNLNKLQEILIRWSIHPIGFHTDIKKMYNTIKLKSTEWCYQRYIWQSNLDPAKIPEEKVVKTLIYGVKSSGNQAEFGLRKVAELSKDAYPKVNEIVKRDVYVDDCLSGEISKELAHKRADQLEYVLNKGGFKLKGVSFAGEDPPSSLSNDGEIIHVAGMKWYPKHDLLSINIEELNFSKKQRGKKPESGTNAIPIKLTRRHCASKVAEVFDLTGKVSPLIASMKIDLQDLVHRKMEWDDVIPENLRGLWESNFQMIEEIGKLKFKRAVIPDDAINLDVTTLDFGDASQVMACVCIYICFTRRNGQHSCQSILLGTQIIPKDMSQPRAELLAALMNTHTGEIVRRSLRQWHQSSIKFTDSQVALHWINNSEKPLKQWVRNRVIEILRFTNKTQWKYIQSSDMIADLGTRKGAVLQDVDKSSAWIKGFPWMQLDITQFPMCSAEELKLSETQLSDVQRESPIQVHHAVKKIPNEVEERYKFSNYLLDPNRHVNFATITRIMAYVMRFCHNSRHKKPQDRNLNTKLSNTELIAAEKYFLQKASDEVRQFVSPKKYEHITTLKDGLLIYKGRVLPEDKISIVGRYTEAMKDLSSRTFCVPVTDKHSPVAYSIVNDIHWNGDAAHAGIETTLRTVLKKVFIIEGRYLLKLIKRSCERCRYLNKRTVDVAMGPVPSSTLTIAPAFYHTQIDLSGPYKAYSPHNKRTTIKVWLVVYCCCSTSAVVINIMDDYSTTSFIQSFMRFACKVGFPKKLFCDEGSQLVKGCRSMQLNFSDVQWQLHKQNSVEFQICPVGGHNMNGKVERKIKDINASLEKTIQNERLSLLQWETITALISNTINNLPLAVRSIAEFECMDLLTPNRLLLGRNNNRSPSGDFIECNNPSRILKENSKIYKAWFETWLLVYVPKLMEHDKWYNSDRNLQIGDIVLFTKNDSVLQTTYTYGRIMDVEYGKDGLVRKVRVRYHNANEESSRETYRSARSLILIHAIDESDVLEELGKMAKRTDIAFSVQS